MLPAKGIRPRLLSLPTAPRTLSLKPTIYSQGITIDIHTYSTYNLTRAAVFVELPAFQRYREQYLDDVGFRVFQDSLIRNPLSGNLIPGTGGLRKCRFADPRRSKGKRSGLRIIYYWWVPNSQFWLFTLYDKNEMDDLTPKELELLAAMLRSEIQARIS